MSGGWLNKLWHIHMTKDYVITKICKQTIYQDMKTTEQNKLEVKTRNGCLRLGFRIFFCLLL